MKPLAIQFVSGETARAVGVTRGKCSVLSLYAGGAVLSTCEDIGEEWDDVGTAGVEGDIHILRALGDIYDGVSNH